MKNHHPSTIAKRLFFFNADAGGGAGGASSAGGAASGAGTLLGGASGGAGGDAGAGGGGAGAASGAVSTWNWAKEDGTLDPGWLAKLPAEYQGAESLKVIGNIPDLAKSYVETKKLIGTKLTMPAADAKPEELQAWRKVVGAPEKPEGYLGDKKTVRPDSIPEGMWDPAGEKAFLEIAHKHSLPPGAVKDILDYYGDSITTQLQASQVEEGKVLEAEGVKLKQAWGQDYDTNLAMASRVAVTVGLDPKTDPVFTSARYVQAFAQFGKLLSEDKLVAGGAQSIANSVASRAQAITDPKSQDQLAREYRGDFGPERQKAAQEQLHQLYAAAAQK